jgi:hypothetical protein
MGSDKKTYTQLNTLGLLGRKSSSALVLDKKLKPLTINDNLLLPPPSFPFSLQGQNLVAEAVIAAAR